MEFRKILKMARDFQIKTAGMKKTDIIRAIQKAENNIDCYGTARIATCGENGCLWRGDCMSLSSLGQGIVES
jgi:hypothetical protein